MKTADQPHSDKLTLKACDGFIYSERSAIIRFEAGHNFVLVYISGYEEPVRMISTLSDIGKQFPFPEFFRCHKSHIVNVEHVKKYENKCRRLTTSCGCITLARERVDEFEEIMKSITDNNNNRNPVSRSQKPGRRKSC